MPRQEAISTTVSNTIMQYILKHKTIREKVSADVSFAVKMDIAERQPGIVVVATYVCVTQAEMMGHIISVHIMIPINHMQVCTCRFTRTSCSILHCNDNMYAL